MGKPVRFIIAVYLTLFMLSLVYNQVVDWLERKGLLDGFKGILVVFGVIYTLLGISPLIGARATLITAGGFVFSLLPVTVGDIKRHLMARLEEIAYWQKVATDKEQ